MNTPITANITQNEMITALRCVNILNIARLLLLALVNTANSGDAFTMQTLAYSPHSAFYSTMRLMSTVEAIKNAYSIQFMCPVMRVFANTNTKGTRSARIPFVSVALS